MRFFKRTKSEKNDYLDFPPIGGLMVSKMITEHGNKPLFMYREKKVDPQDSGWRIFSGYESQEFADDPNNTGIYNPSTILQIDSSISDLLLKGVGSVFEREDGNSDWVQVTDFELDDDYMIEHKLTENWTLKINNLFERIEEENKDLLFTTGDKSLRIAIWNFEGKNQHQLFNEHLEIIRTRDQSEEPTLDIVDLSDDLIKRIGYEIKERDEAKEYGVLYGYSIINNQLLQLAFYYDDPKDKDWALVTWKNLIHSK